MLRSFAQSVALDFLNRPVRSIGQGKTIDPSFSIFNLSEQDREALLLFWDLKHLIQYGLPPVPEVPGFRRPDDPTSPMGPDIDPIPILRNDRDLMFEMIDALAEVGSGTSPLNVALNDRELRLEAAKRHRDRLQTAMAAMDAEIERLNS